VKSLICGHVRDLKWRECMILIGIFLMLLQHSVENAEHLIKRLESFIRTTMDANDDRIHSVVALGRQLIAENNYASDKIQQKTDSLEDR